MSTPDLSIIIVSYKTKDMLQRCLKSIWSETKQTHFEVIVIDNDSQDGTCEMVSEQFPEVTLINSRENHGFARANNIASRETSAPLLLLLNPDTVILDGAIDRLLAFAGAHPQQRMWGGRHRWGDGSHNSTNCWRDYSTWRIFCAATGLAALFKNTRTFASQSYPDYDRMSDREVEVITGCFLLIERGLWDELEGFDERFFLFAEEVDLCRRAREAGARPTIHADAVIIHDAGGSTKQYSEDRRIRLFQARRAYIQKHFGTVQSRFACALIDVHIIIRAVLYGCLACLSSRFRPNQWLSILKRRSEWS